jgi:hypothetical protein
MKIYKYPVAIAENFVIEMPLGAEILSFQSQYNTLTLWAAVWPKSPLVGRKFSTICTGHDIDMDLVKKFIGTAQVLDGGFVFHLFEMK